MNRNIILLFGGESDERLVSVASAQTMAEVIKPSKLWFWHQNGSIYDITYNKLIEHKHPFTQELTIDSDPIFNTINEAIKSQLSDNHVFLLAVHGGQGENGYLQGLLEKAGRPFTGSSAKASEIAFNKVAAKEALSEFPLNFAHHMVMENGDRQENIKLLLEFFDRHGEAIIKPICGGSSIGCFFMRSRAQCEVLADHIQQLPSQLFIVEEVIHGREITVGVVDDGTGPKGLPCTEIVLDSHREFDYQGKYLGQGTKEVTPAPIPHDVAKIAQHIAVMAHTGLSLFGYSRADLILSKDGFYFLEINTLPGFSKQSLVPQQLAHAGIALKDFLTAQIELACRRDNKAS